MAEKSTRRKKRDSSIQSLTHLYEVDTVQSICLLKDLPINPSFSPSLRSDLEFYIPQLVNYMVFFKALGNLEMNHFMLSLVSLNYFFGHLLYWNLNSYSKIYRHS